MTNYRPEGKPGWFESDPAPIPRHEFTVANELHLFPFDEDDARRLDCPEDCGSFCEPANLGEAVDWALGHKCQPEWDDAESSAYVARVEAGLEQEDSSDGN
jgi:hypothetical protein